MEKVSPSSVLRTESLFPPSILQKCRVASACASSWTSCPSAAASTLSWRSTRWRRPCSVSWTRATSSPAATVSFPHLEGKYLIFKLIRVVYFFQIPTIPASRASWRTTTTRSASATAGRHAGASMGDQSYLHVKLHQLGHDTTFAIYYLLLQHDFSQIYISTYNSIIWFMLHVLLQLRNYSETDYGSLVTSSTWPSNQYWVTNNNNNNNNMH